MSKAALEASIYACDNIEPEVVDGRMNFPKTTFAEILVKCCSGVEKVELKNPQNGFTPFFYSVSQNLAEQFQKIGRDDPHFFDACVHICYINILAGQGVPSGMEHFAASVFNRDIKRPTPSNAPRSANFIEQLFIFNLIKKVAKIFGLEITRGEEVKNTNSACDIVARAMRVCGVNKSYSTLRNLMKHEDHLLLRSEINAISKVLSRTHLSKTDEMRNFLNPAVVAHHKSLDDLTISDILFTLVIKPKKK